MNNVIIIGSGPAAYTAAIYLARANLKPLLLEGKYEDNIMPGGLLITTKKVENFPGFPDGIDGFKLMDNLQQQSINFGTEIKTEYVTEIKKENKTFIVKTDNKNEYKSKSILISTGSTPRKLNVPGYDKLWHKGVSTCAVCDGALPIFKNKVIAVVGGGDSACEDALHLTNYASKVVLIHRRDSLRASKILQNRVLEHPKIDVFWNSEVTEIHGTKQVNKVTLLNNKTNTKSLLNVNGVFVAIGHTPNSSFCKNIISCDEDGYIKTNKELSTNIKGIWAAGDVQDKKYRQAITAAGTGCQAALEIERWLYTH